MLENPLLCSVQHKQRGQLFNLAERTGAGRTTPCEERKASLGLRFPRARIGTMTLIGLIHLPGPQRRNKKRPNTKGKCHFFCPSQASFHWDFCQEGFVKCRKRSNFRNRKSSLKVNNYENWGGQKRQKRRNQGNSGMYIWNQIFKNSNYIDQGPS